VTDEHATRIRTMIVDDQDDIRSLMRMLIELDSEVMEVSCEAASAVEALAIIDACDPRVIVLDEMMPGMSGVEAAAAIRARRPDQLLILCTAYLDSDVAARAREAGIAVSVHKDQVRTLPGLIRRLAAA